MGGKLGKGSKFMASVVPLNLLSEFSIVNLNFPISKMKISDL